VRINNLYVSPELVVGLRKLARQIEHTEIRHAKALRNSDPWISHEEWMCCDSPSAARAVAKSGAIDGVRRTGKGRGTIYFARQSALDEWVQHQRSVANDVEVGVPLAGRTRGCANACLHCALRSHQKVIKHD
jgi:hypothetical protein